MDITCRFHNWLWFLYKYINLLSAHLERSNERSKNEISSRTENMLDKQKDLATQVVIVRYLLLECIHNNYLSQNLFLESGMYPI